MVDIELHNCNSVAHGLSKYPQIIKAFRAHAPGYQYTHAFKKQGWDGMVSVFNGEIFPTGLLQDLCEKLTYNRIQYSINDQRVIRPITLHPSTVKLRDYQEDAVDKALTNTLFGTWWPRGVIRIATGGGKTEIAADIILKTRVPTVFLVHRRDLVDQTVERFNKYGIVTGELGQADTVVCTVQSLMSYSMKFNKNYETADGEKRQRSDEWLEAKKARQGNKGYDVLSKLLKIEQVFVDEAHLIASRISYYNMFGTALQLMPHAYMRWGLTATPFMRKHLYDWLLEGSTGRALVSITNRDLIDAGHLTECVVDMINMPKVQTAPELEMWPDCYEHYIVANQTRNNAIAAIYKTCAKPALVLVNKIGHGELLESLLGVPFLSGRSSAQERRQAVGDLRDNRLQGVIASNIWDEGIDIANIKTVILAGGGKSEIKNLQRLGRGLRLANGKNQLQLIDFIDQTPKLLHRHSKARREIWEEQGFKVSVKAPA